MGFLVLGFALMILAVAATLLLIDRKGREITQQLNEARARGMNEDSVSAALQEKP